MSNLTRALARSNSRAHRIEDALHEAVKEQADREGVSSGGHQSSTQRLHRRPQERCRGAAIEAEIDVDLFNTEMERQRKEGTERTRNPLTFWREEGIIGVQSEGR